MPSSRLALAVTILVSVFARQASAQDKLSDIARRADAQWHFERARAESIAVANRLPIRIEKDDGTIIELQTFRRGIPLYYKTDNLNAAKTVSANKVWPGGGFGLSLTGSTETLGEWDGGSVRTGHQEFGGRVLQTEGSLSEHSTHVAGTLIAAGVNSAAHGFSYQASLKEWDFDND